MAFSSVIWLVGTTLPLVARAATPGSLIQGSQPAVYYLANDGKRHAFPNERTYKTWYPDFSSVQKISDAELASIPVGANVTFKPGIRMVKITTDPKVYAVDAQAKLRWVKSEAVAAALYGADWKKLVSDVPDALFVNYSIGAAIEAVADYDRAAITAAAVSIGRDRESWSSATSAGSSPKNCGTDVECFIEDVEGGRASTVVWSWSGEVEVFFSSFTASVTRQFDLVQTSFGSFQFRDKTVSESLSVTEAQRVKAKAEGATDAEIDAMVVQLNAEYAEGPYDDITCTSVNRTGLAAAIRRWQDGDTNLSAGTSNGVHMGDYVEIGICTDTD